MDWLSQNWVWVIAGIAILYFMARGHGHGFGGMHGGGMHGGGTGHGPEGHGGQPSAGTGADAASADGPGAALDPVSGNPVRSDRALTAAYRGRIYYFESRENRERFEAAPEQFAARGGEPAAPREEPPRRRRGC